MKLGFCSYNAHQAISVYLKASSKNKYETFNTCSQNMRFLMNIETFKTFDQSFENSAPPVEDVCLIKAPFYYIESLFFNTSTPEMIHCTMEQIHLYQAITLISSKSFFLKLLFSNCFSRKTDCYVIGSS